jgi:hypothetical protein
VEIILTRIKKYNKNPKIIPKAAKLRCIVTQVLSSFSGLGIKKG